MVVAIDPPRRPHGDGIPTEAEQGGSPHVPVLLDEVLTLLDPRPGEPAADLTVGAGGHAAAILRRTGPDGRLLGLDRDPEALRTARRGLEEFGARVVLRAGTSESLRDALRAESFPAPALILLDLGCSSMQLDEARRGFSFRFEGPLDMRMSGAGPTAKELLSKLDEAALRDALFKLGDEPFARRIARDVSARHRVKAFATTTELAAFVEGLAPSRAPGRRRVHPATRLFQTLRILVNDELGTLERTLPVAWEALAPGGRLAAISFHSGEDRVVKNFLRDRAKAGEAALLVKKPLEAGEAETDRNPRARSAKLRAARKLAPGEDA
jgi:16S rRNA (cytosine1402-N4)-methyltransferase